MFITGHLECPVLQHDLRGAAQLAARCFFKVMYQQDKNINLNIYLNSPQNNSSWDSNQKNTVHRASADTLCLHAKWAEQRAQCVGHDCCVPEVPECPWGFDVHFCFQMKIYLCFQPFIHIYVHIHMHLYHLYHISISVSFYQLYLLNLHLHFNA